MAVHGSPEWLSEEGLQQPPNKRKSCSSNGRTPTVKVGRWMQGSNPPKTTKISSLKIWLSGGMVDPADF